MAEAHKRQKTQKMGFRSGHTLSKYKLNLNRNIALDDIAIDNRELDNLSSNKLNIMCRRKHVLKIY